MNEALRRLEVALVAAAAPVVEHLRRGRSPDDVVAVLDQAGMQATPDLVSWYGWHDGCSSYKEYGPERGFFAWYPFPGLAEVLAWREGEDGRVLLAHEQDVRGWQPQMVLPFMVDVVDPRTVGFALRVADRHLVLLGDVEDGYVEYGTLAEFVELLATAWERGIVSYDDDGYELLGGHRALDRLRGG